MGYPILKLVFDRRGRADKKTEGAIELRITYQRKQKFITTGVRCLPKCWRNGYISNCIDAAERQAALDLFVTNARRTINDLMAKGEFNIGTIVHIINGKTSEDVERNIPEKHRILDYFRERAEIRKYGRAEDSKARYDRFLRWFERWGGMVYWEDVTPANVIKMDEAIGAKMKPKSKWHNYHRFLNSFILDAIADGMPIRNPYKSGLHIRKVSDRDGIHKYLTKDEFARLCAVTPPTEFCRHAQDLFVFQTYTCMAYVDMSKFRMEDTIEVNGRVMYHANRGKTMQGFTFVLLRPAMEVLERYGGKLPLMSNQKYNDQLKILAVMAGIDKPLSSHWARHTGATLLLNSGVDMEVVSHILGHSSTKMTREVYAKMLDTTIADAMTKFEKTI